MEGGDLNPEEGHSQDTARSPGVDHNPDTATIEEIHHPESKSNLSAGVEAQVNVHLILKETAKEE